MNQEEFDNLKCGDHIQCKTHKGVMEKVVNISECSTLDECDTICRCPMRNFTIVQKQTEERGGK